MLTRALFWLALTSVVAAQDMAPTPAPQANPPSAAGSEPPVAPAAAKPEFVYSSVHVNGPYIALTFDDGPHATLTPKLLDLLKERNIKATFFVIGKNAAEYPDILKRTAAEGHEI